MSKGYMGPGRYIMTWYDRVVAGVIILGVLSVVGIFASVIYISAQEKIESRKAAEAKALFHVGDEVQTKIGRFRGIITAKRCVDGCAYLLRIPIASMEPQWVAEYEIEKGNQN